MKMRQYTRGMIAGLSALLMSLCLNEEPGVKTTTAAEAPAAGIEDAVIPVSADVKDNTIMIYMIGSNLESRGGAGSRDILEMSSSGIDLSRSNVVICTGGSKRWVLKIPARQNTVLELNESEEHFETALESEELMNMGDPGTLSGFLDFAVSEYPAEHYGLIFWDHGSGPVMGFGSDELYGHDSLLLPELEQGLADSAFGGKNHLDWIGFDACLMSSIEVADSLSGFADYMIASQETEPGGGWDYSFLSVLNETSDPTQIADGIIDGYINYYEAQKSEMFQPELTLACLDLGQVRKVRDTMDEFFFAMSEKLDQGDYSDLARSRSEAKGYGLALDSEKGEGLDLIDLGNLCEKMAESLPEEAKKLQEVLGDMVIAHQSTVENSCGVSVYYPYTNKEYFESAGQTLTGEVFDSEGYRDYMERYTDIWLSGSQTVADDWVLGEVSAVDGEITMQLSEAQLENFSAASYTILEQFEDQYYMPVLDSVSIEPDENGVLHVSEDQQLFYLWTDGVATNTVWPVKELSKENDRRTYRTMYTGLYVQDSMNGFEKIQAIFSVDDSGDSVMQSVELDSDDMPSGKNTVDLEHWHKIGYNVWQYAQRYGNDGEPLPYTEWIPLTGQFIAHTNDFNETFTFRKENIKGSRRKYYCQITAQTTDGKTYATDITPLSPQDVKETVTVDTEKGNLVYDCYEDYAMLVSYEGTDDFLEIPEEVQSLPLTQIGEYAFRNAKELETILLPDSVTAIGQDAFESCENLKNVRLPEKLESLSEGMFGYCRSLSGITLPESITRIEAQCFTSCSGLKVFEIPESVTYIGAKAFQYCSNLQVVTIPASVSVIQAEAFTESDYLHLILEEGNPNYSLRDGILFSADGKTLVEVPGAILTDIEHYEVPEGTEIIGKGAFRSADNLTEIVFPEGLREIQDEAFYYCSVLEAPVFPDSLESIGHNAFNGGLFFHDESFWEVLHFGKNLSYTGVGAFGGRTISGYDVDPENPNYSSVDGMLCSKAGDVILKIPVTEDTVLEIPEGIVSVGEDTLEDKDKVTELILADSVEIVDSDAGLSNMDKLQKIRLGKSFLDISVLNNCDNISEVELSDENEHYTVVDNVVYDKEMKKLLYYPIAQTTQVLNVPEGVTSIEAGAFRQSFFFSSGNTDLAEVNLPSTLTDIWYYTFRSDGGTFDGLRGLKRINVAEGCQEFSSEDGLLYNEKKDGLIYVPRGIEGTVIIPGTVKTIGAHALGNNGAYSEVYLSEGVERIREDNLFEWYNGSSSKKLKVHLPSSLNRIDVLVDNPGAVVLYVHEGSYAQKWAQELGMETVVE